MDKLRLWTRRRINREDSMALEDFVDSEVGIAIAATAVALSPQVRGVVRKGLVYGLAGALMAGDALGSLARGVGRGASAAATATAARSGQAAAAGSANAAAQRLADLAEEAAPPPPETVLPAGDEGAREPQAAGEKRVRRTREAAAPE